MTGESDEQGWDAGTRAWVASQLTDGEAVVAVTRLRGGWTSEVRRLDVAGPASRRSLVLRSFTEPYYVRHAKGLLTREACTLALLRGTGVTAASLLAVDPTAEFAGFPSLLMSLLPGEVRLDDATAAPRVELLARQLLRIHRLPVPGPRRPRDYRVWTPPDRVRLPPATARPELWRRAMDVVRARPPAYEGCFLHRDFHPGNVLFGGDAGDQHVTGVVDWVETSWGPPDLDVGHCAVALALLHGPGTGLLLVDGYLAAGGRLSTAPGAHLYWQLLSALHYAPDAEKLAAPWRELGRTDLTPALVAARLEDYVSAVLTRYGEP
ncbi:phosphotransferase family protein [Kitasatospora sp. NPDC057223]|uniref:phosphotransferase family protein n=1 Tax=Kitasatospora sp. NPDC057223 TaxID=3346055 RepID=UPI003626B140